jgi:hypothetical protein
LVSLFKAEKGIFALWYGQKKMPFKKILRKRQKTGNGRRGRDRTADFYRVKVALSP